MQEDIINALGTTSFAACYCKKFFRSYWKQTLLFLGFALAPSLFREKSDKQIKVLKEREWPHRLSQSRISQITWLRRKYHGYTVVLDDPVFFKCSCFTATLAWRQQTSHECGAKPLGTSGKNLVEKYFNTYTETIATTSLWPKAESADLKILLSVSKRQMISIYKPNIS